MSDRARNTFVLAIVVALLLVSLLVTAGIPGVVKAHKTHLGLDLQGGIELIYEARPGPNSPVNSASIANTINIIRSRIDTLGVSEPSITQAGNDLIDVQLPSFKNAAQAQSVIGVTGQLYFYDWENSVIGPNGQVAGPNDSNVTGGVNGAGTPAFGISEYDAVMRASKLPAVPTCALHRKAGSGTCYAIESAPYYYVLDKKKTVVVGPASAPHKGQAIQFLLSDLQQESRKLPTGARLVYVPPGSVLVQATSAPEVLVPNAYYVLRDKPFLTGSDISNPQATTDPTSGIVVSFGFKGGAANTFQNLTAVLAHRGQVNTVPGASQNNLQHFAVTLGGAGSTSPTLVTVPSIDFTQFPNGIPSGNGSEITGGFTFAQATSLAQTCSRAARCRSCSSRSPRTRCRRRSAIRRSTRASSPASSGSRWWRCSCWCSTACWA